MLERRNLLDGDFRFRDGIDGRSVEEEKNRM
jgi:hypothetical protein